MTDYAEDVKRYAEAPDEGAIDRIVKYCGIALRSTADAASVAATDRKELDRVRDGFAFKKLGLDAAAADAGIEKVCARMKGNTRKHRVTFYYLLAEETGTLGKLG